MTEHAGGRRLLNATAVMASGTMISRVLGLVRAMLIAFVLGNGTLRVEIFTFAMTVPNSLYMLLAGGTLNNVLVPQIVRAVLHDEDEGRAFIDRIMTGFLIILGALTVVLTAATPLVMSIYTNASWRTDAMAEHWQSLLLMSYVTMPQLFFYGVFFLIGQVLNARDRFGPMMWAPIVNNVVSIAVFGVYIGIWGTQAASGATFTDQQVWLLGLGSTLGIAVQTAVLLPYLRQAGFHYRPRFDLKGTGLGRTFHVAKWMVGYVALTSLAQVVVSNLASTATPINPVTGVAAVGAGWNAYQNADLIWILPHSLRTVSLATAMLPSASKFAAAGDTAGVAAETTRAIRLATTFLLPACLGFLVLADPIVRIIFGNGTGADDYHFVAWTLLAFAVGLVPYTLQYLYLRAFYALDNTRTPFFLQIWISGANALLALLFVLPWNNPQTVAPRLALSYSASYILGAFITHRALKKKLPDLSGRQTWHHLRHLFVATLPAAAAAWGIAWAFDRSGSRLIQIAGLGLAGVVAVLLFFFTAKRMGIPEATQLVNVLRRRPPAAVEVDLPVELAELAESGSPDEPGSPEEPAAPMTPPEADDTQPDVMAEPDPDGVGVFVPVSALRPAPPSVLLEFPDPATPELGPHGTHVFPAVRVLGSRYRLEQQLAVRDRRQIWRAFDEVLARPVLVQLLLDQPGLPEVLNLARRASLATDARFLRVLDVVEAEPGDHDAYLVYEYAPGQTLEKVLRSGPLTGAETAWVVREVADALIPLHTRDLYHRRLSPATLLITSSGNVKILGFLVEDGLEPAAAHLNGEAQDVESLGNLLYAGLVARWPEGDRYGLRAAPHEAGRLLLPSQVRNGVAPAVDAVVDRILSAVPRNHATRLATAREVTTQLDVVLGSTSAAHDLRLRLRPNPAVAGTTASPGRTATLPAVVPPVPTPVHTRLRVSPTEAVETEEETGEDTQPFMAAALDGPEAFTPVPPPPPSAVSSATAASAASAASASEAPEPVRRRRRPFIVGGLGLVLAAALVVAALLNRTPTAPAASSSPLAIRSVDDFDPRADGGSGAENSKDVKLAVDGNAKTQWQTERYRALAAFGGLKPGVGLVLDLGSAQPVGAVTVQLQGEGTNVELRVPADLADQAPMRSASQWRAVASVSGAGGQAVLTPEARETTRFLLVYLTSLPSVGNGYFRGGVVEVVVRS